MKIYGDAARRLAAFLVAEGLPTTTQEIRREHVEAYIEDQLTRWKPATANQRYRALDQFFKWLEAEGEIAESPMRRMKQPTVPEQAVPVISDIDLRKLLAACDGTSFDSRRDTALIRLLMDCGVRAGELMNLQPDQIERDLQVIMVVGKGRLLAASPTDRRPLRPSTGTSVPAGSTQVQTCPGCGSVGKDA